MIDRILKKLENDSSWTGNFNNLFYPGVYGKIYPDGSFCIYLRRFFVLFSKDSMLRKKRSGKCNYFRVFTPFFCQLPAIQVLYNKHRTYSQGHHHNQGFHSFPDRNSGRYCPDHIGFDRLRYGLPRSAPVWPF